MAIDSHMHINSKVSDNEHIDALKIMNDENLEAVINVGLNLKTSKESIKLADQYDKFYASVGIHPLYIEQENVEFLYRLISQKTIAIGEIGLDVSQNNFDVQKDYFISQIHIANDLHLPVIIHSNNTNQQVISIFKNVVRPMYGCVFHCFQPDFDTLSYLVDHDYFISFAGRITYKNAKKSIEIASSVPDDLYLVETDAPFISLYSKENKNPFSTDLPVIIQKIAEIKNKTYDEVEKQTTENAKRLFKIK